MQRQSDSSETKVEEEKLEKAIEWIECLEVKFDIFTLNKAIAVILEKRARSKTLVAEWLGKKFYDMESSSSSKDIRPLEMDLS